MILYWCFLGVKVANEPDFKTPRRVSRSSTTEAYRGAEEVAAVDPSSILSRWEEDNLLSESFYFGFWEFWGWDFVLMTHFIFQKLISRTMTKTTRFPMRILRAMNPLELAVLLPIRAVSVT